MARRRKPVRRLKLSRRGLDLIAEFEGFSGSLYNDPAGHATIGFGHLVHRGPIDGSEPLRFRRGITRRQGLKLLRQDAAEAAAAVRRLVQVRLRQNEFDALVSFVFNLGSGNFSESTLLRKLNQGDYAAVPSELDRWVHAGGQRLAGLVRRRAAEGRLFAEV